MIGHFPRYSADGSRITFERENFWQAQWLDDTREIGHDGERLVIDGQRTEHLAANELSAGGGRWAGWRPDIGVFTSWGQQQPRAGEPAVAPDGEFFYVDDRQADVKTLIHADFRIATGAIVSVRASRTAVVWTMNGRTWGVWRNTARAPQDIQVAPAEFRPIPIDTPDGPWVLNHTHSGIVLRPFGESRGYRFDNGGQTFNPDGVYRNGVIFVIFTDEHGVQTELPFPIGVDRVDLSIAPAPPVATIGRPQLVGWFTDGRTSAPGNVDVLVDFHGNPAPDTIVRRDTGEVLARYIAAEAEGTIEALEHAIAVAQTANPGLPTIAYWPLKLQAGRAPIVSELVGVEAYRRVSESVEAFEQRVRASVAVCPAAVLIAQCYTSNAANTTDLAGLVPVYARIARECRNVLGILAFSAGSRATGWDAHLEVQEPWRALFDGVTGLPSLPAPQPAPVPKPPPPKPPTPIPTPPAPVPVPQEDDPMIAYGSPMAGFSAGDLEDNGNGTVSVKKPNGQYLCVTPEGRVEERPTGGGAWESFRESKSSLIAERDGGSRGALVYVLPLAR